MNEFFIAPPPVLTLVISSSFCQWHLNASLEVDAATCGRSSPHLDVPTLQVPNRRAQSICVIYKPESPVWELLPEVPLRALCSLHWPNHLIMVPSLVRSYLFYFVIFSGMHHLLPVSVATQLIHTVIIFCLNNCRSLTASFLLFRISCMCTHTHMHTHTCCL